MTDVWVAHKLWVDFMNRFIIWIGAFYDKISKIDTLESGIDVGQGINVGPGKFGEENKHRAWIIWQK